MSVSKSNQKSEEKKMDTKTLLAAMKVALTFSSKDRSRPHMYRIAVSETRVRATDGHRAIHIWEKGKADADVGFVAHLDPANVKLVSSIVAATTRQDAPVRRRKRGKAPSPFALPDLRFDKDSFRLGDKTYPLVDFALPGEVLPPTDKVLSKTANPGGIAWMAPNFIADAARAFEALGVTFAAVAPSGLLDPVQFYGETETLCVLVVVMPIRPEAMTFEKRMEERATKVAPPKPKTEADKIREQIAALNEQLAKVA